MTAVRSDEVTHLPPRRRHALAVSSGRPQFPLPSAIEATARVAYAYVRNQYGLRDRRPLGRFLARNVRFLLAGLREPTIEAQAGTLRLVVPTSDRTIGRSIYASGDWDPLLVGTVFRALRQAGRDVAGTTFLEIGANFGVYSLPAVAGYGFARAVAYEPDPASFSLLVANIRRNGLQSVVRAVNAALSDAPGELRLSRSPNNAGDNRVLGETAPRRRGGDEVVVRATTFDDEVASGAIPLGELGLVWLDVQGHEASVLAGARRLVEADVPIVLEYSSGMMDDRARARLHEMIAGGYEVMVDLGWSALTNRLRFLPAASIHRLLPPGRGVETDLLLLKRG